MTFAKRQFVQRAVYPVKLRVKPRRSVVKTQIVNVRRGLAVSSIPR